MRFLEFTEDEVIVDLDRLISVVADTTGDGKEIVHLLMDTQSKETSLVVLYQTTYAEVRDAIRAVAE